MNFDINNHIVKLNSLFIDINTENISPKSFNYLFILRENKIYGNYIININIDDFKNYIKLCLQSKFNTTSKINFELDIISLICKFYDSDIITKKIICIMIGKLILSNIKYKNFYYLKKLELFFHVNDEIKYLLILITNIIECNPKSVIYKPYIKVIQDSDIIDFIFDYYSDN